MSKNPRREELKAISAPLKSLLLNGEVATINEALRKIYAEQGHLQLKTLRQWNECGFVVKKGSKALLLWGAPKKLHKKKESESGEESDYSDFFPICYVFSENQTQAK